MPKKSAHKRAATMAAQEPEPAPPPESLPDERMDGGDDWAASRQAMSAMAWLLFYSTAMFTLPFVAFYGTRYGLSHYLQIEGFPNTCGSVAAAVLVVNIIIMLYALRGYEDAQEDDRQAGGTTEEQEAPTKQKKKSN
ncbi:uncharacterized protein LOC131206615 isoform X3 [Anopheles bellator]|uniref:uncharacterized protein LOC131206615 isoform X3 n=1 Tax=Anopheles bellator TaxID=139047 RepID=UPI00264A070F|nr:uncharacterized protein LOC131206615 isoform X3 [Anopheles bellator]